MTIHSADKRFNRYEPQSRHEKNGGDCEDYISERVIHRAPLRSWLRDLLTPWRNYVNRPLKGGGGCAGSACRDGLPSVVEEDSLLYDGIITEIGG